jgi:hypothetical protein
MASRFSDRAIQLLAFVKATNKRRSAPNVEPEECPDGSTFALTIDSITKKS